VTNPDSLPSLYSMQDISVLLDSLYYFISHTSGLTDLLYPYPAPHFKTSQVFLIQLSKCPSFSPVQSYVPNVTLRSFFLKFKSNLLVKRAFFFSNVAISMAILDLNSRTHAIQIVEIFHIPRWLTFNMYRRRDFKMRILSIYSEQSSVAMINKSSVKTTVHS